MTRTGRNTLRVSLTPEDLEAFAVELNDFDETNEKGRKAVLKLCDLARTQTDFSFSQEKVYVQMYPKNNGGCELFFIRLEQEESKFFLFSSFDSFYSAWSSHPDSAEECAFYKFKHNDRFLVQIPSLAIPPSFLEFGKPLKKSPSPLYVKTQCKRIGSPFLGFSSRENRTPNSDT